MGFRCVKNLCYFPSPSPASPLFHQREPCLLQLQSKNKAQNLRQGVKSEPSAVQLQSTRYRPVNVPQWKMLLLPVLVRNAAVWWSPHAKDASSLTLKSLNSDLQFATPIHFYQPGFMIIWQKHSSNYFQCSPTPPSLSLISEPVSLCTDKKAFGSQEHILSIVIKGDMNFSQQYLAFSQIQILYSTWCWSHGN